ncbi:tetratricopeptide repeat protein [Oleiharenicola lentus]|uniref:tetratricopeptide repeat protein n=1 Tax=Oleiharenicola lentus TaxID=2508720 RepID=UPI003F66EDA6
MIIERDNLSLRWVLIILGGLGVGIAAVIYFSDIKQTFLRWKQGGSVAQVKKFTTENDVPNALLAIRTALQQEPGNATVWRMAADFAEQLGDADSVNMREQVVRLEPGVLENRLALARTALRFKDVLTARETLEKIPPAERLSSDYRRVVAALAIVSDLPAEAAAQLTLIVEKEPGDLQARLDRSTLALRYASSSLAAAALGELQALEDRPETRVRARRELAAAALRNKDYKTALDYANRLTEESAPQFTDFLLKANIEIAANTATVTALRPQLIQIAASNPVSIAELSAWLRAMNQPAEAARWLQTLPPEIQSMAAVKVARADAFIALRDWEAARALLADGAYGRISPDAVQLAFAARVFRDNDRDALQRSAWDEAIRLAGLDLPGLRVLHRLALEWGWGPELNSVLFAIATKHPSQTWAYQALVERHYRARDTSALKAVYNRWREAEPGSTFVESNALFLELLTAPVKVSSKTKERAAELYASDDKNAFFATIHAFSLWQSERAGAALAVMEKLPLTERRAPTRVLYMALFQSGIRRQEAQRYLALVQVANLLPEEATLYRSLVRSLEAPVETTPAPKPVKKT